MKTIKKKKSISKEYHGVSVNERDLSYLAKLVQELAEEKDAKISIEIISADGEDLISSDIHTVFYSNDIPNDIDSVKIYLSDYRSSIKCRIDMNPNFFQPARVTIYGEDTDAVSALFREIDRELTKMQFQDILKLKYLNSFWYAFILGTLLAVAVYSLFDFAINTLDVLVVGFDNSVWRKTLAKIGWILIGISLIIGGTFLTSRLQNIFPKVRFTGKFKDRYHKQRKNLIWVLVALILPILLNLISSFVWNGT